MVKRDSGSGGLFFWMSLHKIDITTSMNSLTLAEYIFVEIHFHGKGMEIMKSIIKDGINQIIESLKQAQSPNGSWNYPFETGISTDCYTIILLRTLEINDENLIEQLTKRILSKQENDGAWKLFSDQEGGSLTVTIEAYYALLYSGLYSERNPKMVEAKQFILANGGIEKAHMFAKIMLAVTGQMKWPIFFPIPVETILLPTSFPINFYSFSVYGRANLTPIMILADRKFQIKTEKSPDLSDLFLRMVDEYDNQSFHFRESEEWRSFYSVLEKGIKSLVGLPSQLHKHATKQAEQYMLTRVEPDGTFYCYYSSTFLMIFALLALGYSKTHPVITNAVKGLLAMKCVIKGFTHMQYTTATVWNTSLINYALLEAGVSPSEPMVDKANRYLLNRQHNKFGDWVVHNPFGLPGGWGFSDMNTVNPDVDDTTASLRAIARKVKVDPTFRQSWDRGINWVLSMQNDDGGWAAFEKNTNSKWLQFFPIEKAEFILTDPSSADLTGRTLEFLCSYTNLSTTHSSIQNGVNWLIKNQEKNGSWYGRWGICYIYGTWTAVTGLKSAGVRQTDRSISKATLWLKQIQNKDGGWGESCKSDSQNTYIPLNTSTLTHTAWAVDTLLAASDKPTNSINAGIKYLLDNLDREDWTTDYPVGQGMAGDFYIHYHSYRYIFPLLALAHYQKKYLEE